MQERKGCNQTWHRVSTLWSHREEGRRVGHLTSLKVAAWRSPSTTTRRRKAHYCRAKETQGRVSRGWTLNKARTLGTRKERKSWEIGKRTSGKAWKDWAWEAGEERKIREAWARKEGEAWKTWESKVRKNRWKRSSKSCREGWKRIEGQTRSRAETKRRRGETA